MAFSLWSTTTTLLLALAFIARPTSATPPTVNEVFHIKPGTTAGGCDNHASLLRDWFKDAQALTDAALRRVQRTDADSAQYLATFFGLKLEHAAPVADRLRAVRHFLHTPTSDDPADGANRPWLFCSDAWLREQAWTEVAYDSDTGQPRQDGKRIRDLVPDAQQDEIEFPYWSSDLSSYLVLSPEMHCTNGQVLGASGREGWDVWSYVALCTENIAADRHRVKALTLSQVRPVTDIWVQVAERYPASLVLLHEIFHIVNSPMPDWAYEFAEVIALRPDHAIENPETYVLYALALWLAEKNEAFSFSPGWSVILRHRAPK
ncbi:hypothetical protein P8C59_006834 [Phyllachora maydis]|uniref:Uncharacterized protein n=1 Tax=Phyllachora maydis TaxID=1825666 RepID=A0AAD9I739_9PEZI|nr:hypothetical protein P8C59_006834 [Phyllachora maydis]